MLVSLRAEKKDQVPLTHPIRCLVLLVAVLVMSTGMAGPAFAHVDLASSVPEDGATVAGPLSAITLLFSAESVPADEGIVVLDASGVPVASTETVGSDGLTWTLVLDQPIQSGAVGIRWTMRAGDAHPRQGAILFDVLSTNSDPVGVDAPSSGIAAVTAPSGDAVDALTFALAPDDSSGWALRLIALGRAVSFVGVLLAVGGFIFASFVLRGQPSDVRRAGYWVRRFSALSIVGVAIELVCQVAIDNGGAVYSVLIPTRLLGTLISVSGLAIAMRGVGAFALLRSFHTDTELSAAVVEPVERLHRALPGAAGPATATLVRARTEVGLHRLGAAASPRPAAAVLLMVCSFALDGHTVSIGSWPLMAVASVAHVTAAATWAGGVVSLGIIVHSWSRMDRAKSTLLLAARFSVVAALALATAGAAGLALTWAIVDTPMQLVSTGWGRVLVAKVALVAVAAGIGYHNHTRLIPQMMKPELASGALSRFRTVLYAEGAVFALIMILSAILVGSNAG